MKTVSECQWSNWHYDAAQRCLGSTVASVLTRLALTERSFEHPVLYILASLRRDSNITPIAVPINYISVNVCPMPVDSPYAEISVAVSAICCVDPPPKSCLLKPTAAPKARGKIPRPKVAAEKGHRLKSAAEALEIPPPPLPRKNAVESHDFSLGLIHSQYSYSPVFAFHNICSKSMGHYCPDLLVYHPLCSHNWTCSQTSRKL